MKVEPVLKPGGVFVDPLNFLQQYLASFQQQQLPHLTAPSLSSSSSSSSSAPTTVNTDVAGWQQQQLRAIRHQLLLTQGLPTVMPTTVSQPGSAASILLSLCLSSPQVLI